MTLPPPTTSQDRNVIRVQVAARPVCMALLAYDTGGRRAAIAQMHRSGLTTEHCGRGVDESPAAAASNESGDGSTAGAERGVESVGEWWLFPRCTRPRSRAGRR